MDLLEYTQQLIKSGNSSQQQQAYKLQELIQGSSMKGEKEPKNANNTPFLIGGLVIFGIAALALGYLWVKERTKINKKK
jgi:hypothetical protein